ncbi:unnamed protein product [Arabidopsis halleri]
MKSIVFFFLLLLFAVATSDNVINDWSNLTAVHEDEVIWSSFAPMMKGGSSYITYPVLRGQQSCVTIPIYITGASNPESYGSNTLPNASLWESRFQDDSERFPALPLPLPLPKRETHHFWRFHAS